MDRLLKSTLSLSTTLEINFTEGLWLSAFEFLISCFGYAQHALKPITLNSLVLLAISNTVFAQPITVTDDFDNTVSIPKPADRIIALSPHSVEQLFSLGVGDNIIATITYADYPQQAKSIKRIGDAMSINYEEIISLKPDLIVAWGKGTQQTQIDRLKQLGIPVFLSGSESLKSIPSSLIRLGDLVGATGKAKHLVQQFQHRLEQFKNNVEQLKDSGDKTDKPRVFIQIWGSPIRTIGGGHLVDEIIGHCGGENIYHDHKQSAPVVSVESLLKRNPQIAILNNKKDGFSTGLSELIKPWMNIAAVKNNQICRVDFDTLLRPTMRVLDGMGVVCGCIENYSDSNHPKPN